MKLNRPLLLEARRLILTKEEPFICFALATATRTIEASYDDFKAARNHIEQAIAPSGCLSSWLALQLKIDSINRTTVRMARLAWLDKLIEEASQ